MPYLKQEKSNRYHFTSQETSYGRHEDKTDAGPVETAVVCSLAPGSLRLPHGLFPHRRSYCISARKHGKGCSAPPSFRAKASQVAGPSLSMAKPGPLRIIAM